MEHASVLGFKHWLETPVSGFHTFHQIQVCAPPRSEFQAGALHMLWKWKRMTIINCKSLQTSSNLKTCSDMQQRRNYWKCLKIIENAIPSIIEGILPLPREFFLYRNLLTCVNSVISHVLYSKQYFNMSIYRLQYVHGAMTVPRRYDGRLTRKEWISRQKWRILGEQCMIKWMFNQGIKCTLFRQSLATAGYNEWSCQQKKRHNTLVYVDLGCRYAKPRYWLW